MGAVIALNSSMDAFVIRVHVCQTILTIKRVHLCTMLVLCAVSFKVSLLLQIFRKYIKHRDLILEDIFASLARLPSSKRTLRSYRFVLLITFFKKIKELGIILFSYEKKLIIHVDWCSPGLD